MGRGHGGSRGGGAGGGVSMGRTEAGHSQALAKGVIGVEKEIRNRDIEYAFAFDDSGNVVYSEKGYKDHVNLDARQIKDRVVTHNHPDGWDSPGLSGADMRAVVQGDMKEFRAVTANKTFSIKRPEKGWGKAPGVVTRKYNDAVKKQVLSDREFLRGYKGDIAMARRRLDNTFYHRVTKTVATSFGWDYTYKTG